MENNDFTISFDVAASPQEVFNAITNVRGWWSEEVNGNSEKLSDEFTYQYMDVHRCNMRLIEVVPDKRMVWLCLDNYFSFTEDKAEWIGTKIVFEISRQGEMTRLHFTHQGLVPEYECYNACTKGWTQYIQQSLKSLITTGEGQPNSRETPRTIYEVVERFNDLAKEEKWFAIQDELFAENVRSVEPVGSQYFKYAEGKVLVRKKGEDFVKGIEAVHRRFTTEPIIAGNHFAVGREMDVTVNPYGRIQINEIMLYEVKDGKIVLEQFFY